MNAPWRWQWLRFVLPAVIAAGSARALPGPGVAMRDLGFKTGKLDLPSGMRIVIEEDHSQPLVAFVAVVDVGSAQDPPGKEGLAHLVEHLTFRARPDGKVQRSNLLDFAGAAGWNAFTSHDLTTYVVVAPKEALKSILALEGGRLLRPLAGLDLKTFEVERGVVQNELSQTDEQGRVSAVEQRLYAALYPEGHPYHRSIAGTEASVATLTLGDAEAFVEQYYQPRNMTLYIAGDVDIASIGKIFDASLPPRFLEPPPEGPIAPPQRLSPTAPPVPPLAPAKPLETVHAPAEAPVLYIAWSLPRGFGPDGHLERFTRQVFEAVSAWAGTGSSDVAGVRTWLDRGKHGTTLICAVLLKEGKNPERSLERVLDQVIRIWEPSNVSSAATTLSADRSFARLQRTALVGFALQSESVLGRAEEKATLVHLTGDLGAWGKDIAAIAQLSAPKMEQFAFEWLARDRARAVFVEPSGAARTLDAAGRPTVFAPADDIRVKIDAGALRTYVHPPGGEVKSVTLKNGLEVILVRRESSPTVTVTLGFRGGEATGNPLGAPELAQMLASPLKVRNGPPSLYGARVSSWATTDATYLQGRAASGNLENLLAIISDRVDSMHVDAAMKVAWDEVVAALRRDEARPSARSGRTFRDAVYPGSPYGRTAVGDNFDRLGGGDVQGWINRTYRPKNAVMAVVGDIDFADAELLIRQWFEGWNGDVDPTAEAPLGKLEGRDGPPRVLKVERPGAKQTEIRLGCSILPTTPTDRIALRLLGSQVRGRIGTLARSALGGSYGFSGGAQLQRGVSELEVSGLVDDKSLTRVLAQVRKELDDLGAVKPTEQELSLLKWRLGTAFNVRYSTNAELAQGLVWVRLAGLPLSFVQGYPGLLAAVTPEDVTRVAAACRRTAVLLVNGDPGVVDAALKATRR